MRLSTNQIFNQGVKGILDTQARLTKAQDRLTNQTKLLTPSDDPAATAQVLRLNERIELTKQYEANGVILENHLNAEEVSMNGIKTALDRAKVLVIQAGSGSLTDSDRVGISFEIASIRDEVFDLMNTRNAGGDYIFSGFQSNKQPFEYNQATNVYDYKGDEGELKIQISASVKLSAGDNGKRLFEDVDDRLKPVNGVVSAGAGTSASVAVESQGQFDDFHKQNFDPVTPANNTYNMVLTAGAPDSYQITKNGAALVPAVTGQYNPGSGVNFQGLNIQVAGNGVPGQIDFTLSTPGKKNIATTLNDLFDSLNKGGGFTPALKSSLRDALTQTTNAAGQIATVQASLGGRLNVVDSILASNLEINHANQKARSDLAEVDYAEAVTELMKEESALEAAQATFGRVSRLSLFDFIR
ncbi:MAG: flagellar hook-associated protein 3 FlgL [Alteromonadaceae bacterium]|jgi:flagellar hook-associated protein 3 FlgL